MLLECYSSPPLALQRVCLREVHTLASIVKTARGTQTKDRSGISFLVKKIGCGKEKI